VRIKIVGLGGAGVNAIDRMKLEDLEQLHLAVVDSDSQVLAASPVDEKILLPHPSGSGRSAGGQPEIGAKAAEAAETTLRKTVSGMDIVFLVTGLGGGTGSGAGPLLAELAADDGALVIAFVTLPFAREGKQRAAVADAALAALRVRCHAVICLPNDTVFKHIDPSATLMEAFARADKWIKLGIHSIWSMIFNTGMVNVDFSTLQNALAHRGGRTLFATGYGKGEQLVEAAIQDLDRCPLLSSAGDFNGIETDQLIVHLCGGPDLTLATVDKVMAAVAERFACHNSMVMGASIDGNFHNQLRVTVLGSTRSKSPVRKGYEPVPSASIAPNKPLSAVATAPRQPATGGAQSAAARQPATAAAPTPAPALTAPRQQEEFSFAQDSDQRGLFDKVSPNLYEGVDLDIPTYIRRKMRLPKV
jgi:cell division protein FtsZ